MTDLRKQRRLASEVLKVGENRVWIDPERTEDVDASMTREEIRKLVHENVIKAMPKKGISHARARVIHEKKKQKRRRGPGTRTGSSLAKISKKEAWMSRIRALRKRLRALKTNKIISENTYRRAYKLASSGRFVSNADLERYLKTHDLWRKR
jgi:large subunit ribosomal protein L19e